MRPRRRAPPLTSAVPPFLTLTLACLGGGAACRGGSASPSVDAAADRPTTDGPGLQDGGLVPLALEFTVTGCTMFDVDSMATGKPFPCVGMAALTLRFTPIATVALDRFQWTFGDGSPASTESSPSHTYALPGTYTVALAAAGAAGSVTRVRTDYVHVVAVPPGGACDVDGQCEMGRPCWCGAGAPCDPILVRGFCADACSGADRGAACVGGTTCIDLSQVGPFAVPPADHSPWGRALCLEACADDAACPAGTRCRSLLSPVPPDAPGDASPPSRWTQACFPGYPLAVGARCNDATGAPADVDCVTGLCAPLGRFGRCSLDCSQSDCPPDTACATWLDGRRLCLAACTPASPCDDDPLLDCEAPGTAAGGFTLEAQTPTALARTYCAPKSCASALDCGPGGTCPASGGQCAPLGAPP